MVKYIILADSSVGFEMPRQLSVVCGEPIIKRTIRLLKENGIKDILITSHDKRFDNLGVERYEPLHNYYVPNLNDYKLNKGYWLNAFPIELLNQPICFLFGDVYYSENAIKTIIETPTKSTLFFCSYENKDKRYIKHHDEPLGYKVVDYELFKKHIDIVKELKDKGKCCREPIVWELYRSINGQEINTHIMTKNYIAINDESCDIDTLDDIIKLNEVIGGEDMIRCEVIKHFTLEKFNELRDIQRKGIDVKGHLYVGDTFECDKKMAEYLTGKNEKGDVVVKIIEVKPKIINTGKDIIIEAENIKIGNIPINNTTTTYKNDVPTTNGLAINTEYKNSKPKKSKKSKK